MKNYRRFCLAVLCSGCLLLGVASALAGEDGKEVISPDESAAPAMERPQFHISAEYNFEETYVGDSSVSRGRHTVNDFDEKNTVLDVVLTPRVSFGLLRLGVAYERFDFGFADGSPLPDVLQSANLVVGLDTQLSDSILVRFEAQPGYYGAGVNDLEWEDVNVPFVIGGTYIYSPSLQLVLGIGVDVNRKYPVVPGGGIRWRFAPQWTLNAVLPSPRLEFELNRNMTLYAGGHLKSETFRLGDDFGAPRNQPQLNRAVFNYTEIRAGGGFDWKLTPSIMLSAEAGYLVYREFDFFRTDVRYHHEEGAPYGSISLHGAF
jgi:Domain of unknown function (DUF6268)